MPSGAHDDIRKILKEFGLTADETISEYLVEMKPSRPLQVRIVLEDLTEYESPPEQPLRIEVEGTITP